MFNKKSSKLIIILGFLAIIVLLFFIGIKLTSKYKNFIKAKPDNEIITFNKKDCLSSSDNVSPSGKYKIYLEKDNKEKPTQVYYYLSGPDCSEPYQMITVPYGVALPFNPVWSPKEDRVILSEGAGEWLSLHLFDLSEKKLYRDVQDKVFNEYKSIDSIKWQDNDNILVSTHDYPKDEEGKIEFKISYSVLTGASEIPKPAGGYGINKFDPCQTPIGTKILNMTIQSIDGYCDYSEESTFYGEIIFSGEAVVEGHFNCETNDAPYCLGFMVDVQSDSLLPREIYDERDPWFYIYSYKDSSTYSYSVEDDLRKKYGTSKIKIKISNYEISSQPRMSSNKAKFVEVVR